MAVQTEKSKDKLNTSFNASASDPLAGLRGLRDWYEKDPGEGAQFARDISKMFQDGKSFGEIGQYIIDKVQNYFGEVKDIFIKPEAPSPMTSPAAPTAQINSPAPP